MHQIKKDGFTFDVGPTIVMMLDVFKELFADVNRHLEDYLTYERVEPMLEIFFNDEESIPFSSDLVLMIKEMEQMSEEDALGFIEFLANIYKKYLIAKEAYLTRSFRKPTDFYNLKSLWKGLQLKTFNDAYSELSKYVKDERLRKSLAFQTVYIGVSPYQGPSLYTIIPMIELFYGVHYFHGGMHAFAEAMEKLFLELGGKIQYQTAVDEIVIEDKQTKGIRVADRIIESDYVVCNADFPYAMKQLIPNESKRGKYTDKKIDRMEYSCSCLLFYLGVDKTYDLKSMHAIYFADDFQRNINDIFEKGILPADPSIYLYTPSVVDESMAPEGMQSIYVLVPVPELSLYDDWDANVIVEYRHKIMTILQTKTPLEDLESHIISETIYTPHDFENRFNAYNGATFGLKPTLLQSNYYRPHNKFKYADSLYFCGSSTHPGAGVPIVLQSAKLTVEELLRDGRDR